MAFVLSKTIDEKERPLGMPAKLPDRLVMMLPMWSISWALLDACDLISIILFVLGDMKVWIYS